MTKKLAFVFSLTAFLLLAVVGIKFSDLGQRGDGVLGTAEAAQTTIIDTSTLSSVTTGLQRKLVQTSQNVLVLFYFDGSAIASKKSVNQGNTWAKWDGSDGKEIIVTNSNIGSIFSVAIDNNNNIYLAYYIPSSLYFRKLSYDSQTDTWSIGNQIDVDGGSYVEQDGPGIVKDSIGRIWISFRDYNGSYGRGVKVTYSDDEGQTWSNPELLMSSGGGTLQPSTLILKDNYPACVYAVNGTILRWRIWNGETWSQEETIYTPSKPLYSNFSAAVTSNGYIHLLFGESQKIKYTYFDNSQWSSPIILNTIDSLYPSLTTDGLNLFAFWSQYAGQNQYNIVYQRFNGASWGNTNFITADNQNNLYPSTMLVSTDYVPVVWTEGTSPYNIKFSKISFGSSPESPSLVFPSTGETNIDLTPLFQLSAVDADNNNLKYKIELALDSAFTQNSQTFDQTQEIQGWNKSLYTSGETATYTLQISLAPHTIYYWRAYAIDPEDTNRWSQASEVWSFTTGADTTPPIISDEEAIDISENAATIIWTTDEPATSQVEYGTTTDYGMLSPEDAAPTTSHFVNLSGLYSSTIYHFRIRSKDETSNEANSKDYTFKTAYHVGVGHPRLYITPDSLNTIRERCTTTHLAEYQRLIQSADSSYNLNVKEILYRIKEDITVYGLIYQVGKISGVNYGHSITEYGERGKAMLLEYADRMLLNPSYEIGYDAWKNQALAIGYDWLYPLLNGEEQAKVISAIIVLDEFQIQSRDGDDKDDMSNWSTGQRQYVIGALAYYQDDVYVDIDIIFHDAGGYGDIPFKYQGSSDVEAQKFVNLFESKWREGVLGAQELVAADDGGWHESHAYSTVVFLQSLPIVDAWRTATGENLFKDLNFYRYYTQWLTYIAEPQIEYSDPRYAWRPLKISNDKYRSFSGRVPMLAIASRYNELGETDIAGLSQWWAQGRLSYETKVSLYPWTSYPWEIIWYDKTIAPKSPSEVNLPLTKHFEGLGWVGMRTGFENEDDTIALFIAQPYRYGGHDHYHQNSFTISKMGGLALDSGMYEGDHGMPQEVNYNPRTIAHNSIIIYDPNEVFKITSVLVNDGGQRVFYRADKYTDFAPGTVWDVGGIEKFESVPEEYDYILADATRAYQSTLYTDNGNSPKISEFTRQFVYLRPDIFVVFDRVNSTNPDFSKKWLLHMPFEPVVSGNESIDPIYSWHKIYDGDFVRFDSGFGSGRLFSQTLLPKAHRIVKIGGPGHEFEGAEGESWPLSLVDYEDWMGAWRIEVQPTEAKTDDIFLHVLQVTDSKITEMTEVELVEEDNWTGVIIDDPSLTYNKVLFTKTGDPDYQITSTTVTPKPNLNLTKSAQINNQPAIEAKQNDIITYTITYQNIGTGDAKNIIITDPIPQGTSYVAGSADATAGSFGGTQVVWNISEVKAGGSGSVSFEVRVE